MSFLDRLFGSAHGDEPPALHEAVAWAVERIDPRLKNGAALTTLAHLEDLCARGLVATDGPPQLTGVFGRS